MGSPRKSNPCRECPTRLCLKECETKRQWVELMKKGLHLTRNFYHGSEALRIAEQKTRMVRQGLEEQLRREMALNHPKSFIDKP